MGEATRTSENGEAGGKDERRGSSGRDRMDENAPADTQSLVQDTADLVKTPPGEGLKNPDGPARDDRSRD